MRWYVDNSDVHSGRGAKIPDVVLMGGFAIRNSEEKQLQAELEKVKERYGGARAPVKWNMRDLQPKYRETQCESVYKKLLQTAPDWRRDMFKVADGFDMKIIVSCVESYSVRRAQIVQNKGALASFAFCNGLMRYAMHVQEHGKEDPESEVFLDWPEKSQPLRFNQEYQSAYNKGTAIDTSMRYYTGPLKGLNFADSVRYTPMCHSTLLQFADLVVGATREFIQHAEGKTSRIRGLELLKMVRRRVRGYPGANIVGKGICIHGHGNRLNTVVKRLASQELT